MWHIACSVIALKRWVTRPSVRKDQSDSDTCRISGPGMGGAQVRDIDRTKEFPKLLDRTEHDDGRADWSRQLQNFNNHCEASQRIATIQEHGKLVAEGPLRIHWGVATPIQLKQKDDSLPKPRQQPKQPSWRRSYAIAITNGLEEQTNGEEPRERRDSLEEARAQLSPGGNQHPTRTPPMATVSRYNTVAFRGERKRNKVSRRWSMINGHVYDVETSSFTPTHGTATSVTVTNLDTTPAVIRSLLDKFKVVNNPDDFCLCAIQKGGERRVLNDGDIPLLQRVLLGPVEDQARIFIMEKPRSQPIPSEVAEYVSLPEAMLRGFLEKYKQEEHEELENLMQKYSCYKEELEKRLSEISTQM